MTLLKRHPLLVATVLLAACQAPTPAEEGARYVDPRQVDALEGTQLGSFDVLAAVDGIVADMRAQIGVPTLGRPWLVWSRGVTHSSGDPRIDPELFAEILTQKLDDEARGFAEVVRPEAEAFAGLLKAEQRQGLRAGEVPARAGLVPDFLLEVSIRALERNPRAGISRWYVIRFSLTDLDGVVRWSKTFDPKKREDRPIAYQ